MEGHHLYIICIICTTTKTLWIAYAISGLKMVIACREVRVFLIDSCDAF